MVHPKREAGFTGWDDIPGYSREVNTPRGYWVRGDVMHIHCCARGCRQHWEADLQAYMARGWGDVDLMTIRPRWRCPHCGTRDISTSRGDKGAYGPPRRGREFGSRW